MDKKDSIFLKMIALRSTIRSNLKIKDVFFALDKLEKKYPQNYNIKKQIIKIFKENNLNDEAILRLKFICHKYQKYTDFSELIALSFANNALHLDEYLNLIKNNDERAILRDIVKILEKKEFEFNYDELIESKYPLNFSINETSNINEYKFNQKYTKIISLIENRQFSDALEMSFDIFKVSTYHDSIQFMIDNEKIELLFYLSKYSVFFEKYYNEALKKVKRSLVKILETCISIKSIKFVEEFANIMKNRSDESSNQPNYSLDDQSVKDFRLSDEKVFPKRNIEISSNIYTF